MVNKFVLSQQFNHKQMQEENYMPTTIVILNVWNRAVLAVAFNTFTR